MTDADWAELERRVSALEDEVRAGMFRKLDAVAYELSVMHHEIRGIAQQLGDREQQLNDHGQLLGEIIRRLPVDPAT